MKAFIRNFLLVLGLVVLPGLARAQLQFETNGSAITITGYSMAAGYNVVIPASTNGYPVTAIGGFAFQTASTITNVVIPNSIGSIGNYAFNACIRLKSVTIPASVTNLGLIPFSYCPQMTNIIVDPANPAFSSLGGVLFDKAQTTLIEGPTAMSGNYVVPASVTNITWAALASCGISGVSIHSGVLFIEWHTFNSCINLTNISVAGGNPNYVSVGGVLFDKALTTLIQYPCALGTNYDVPEGVVVTGPDAFAYSGLSRLTLPRSLNYITYELCFSCTNLASIVIPAAVTNVGFSAFAYCTNLSTVYFAGSASVYSDGGPGYGSDVFYGDSVTVYYLPGTTNWQFVAVSFSPKPVLWDPQAVSPHFNGSGYGFNLTGPTNATIVVEACTDLVKPVWVPVSTNKFSGSGTAVFSDAQAGNFAARYYRMRSP